MYGWSGEVDSSDAEICLYFLCRLKPSTQDGVLLWGNRVVVPPQGHEAVLMELHTSHPGVACMKTLARVFLWWPHLDFDIEAIVKSCSQCQSNCPMPTAVPMKP